LGSTFAFSDGLSAPVLASESAALFDEALADLFRGTQMRRDSMKPRAKRPLWQTKLTTCAERCNGRQPTAKPISPVRAGDIVRLEGKSGAWDNHRPLDRYPVFIGVLGPIAPLSTRPIAIGLCALQLRGLIAYASSS
jgi:hypothetical protein